MSTYLQPQEMSWRIEQDGEVICSQSQPGLQNMVFTTDCCIDYEKEYTITCEDSASDGWDVGFQSYSYHEDLEFDGYLLLGDVKYCDKFYKEISYTISRKHCFIFVFL